MGQNTISGLLSTYQAPIEEPRNRHDDARVESRLDEPISNLFDFCFLLIRKVPSQFIQDSWKKNLHRRALLNLDFETTMSGLLNSLRFVV